MELNMYELAEQLKQLREEKKDAEQRVKDINVEIDKTEYALFSLWQKRKYRISPVQAQCFRLQLKLVRPQLQDTKMSCILL